MPRFPRIPRRNRPPGPPPASSSAASASPSASSISIPVPTPVGTLTVPSSNQEMFQFTFDHVLVGMGSATRMYPRSSSFLEPDVSPEHPNPHTDVQDSQSLSESVINYPEEFGRTYPAFRPGSYFFPNDVLEQRRAELQYHTLNEVANFRLHFAPWSPQQPPLNVLDVATGTGLWAIDFADQYPDSRVEGNDLSPVQPKQVPPNVHFFVEDAEETWEFSTPFDYIHTRCCLGSFRNFNTGIIQQAFQHLTPGGWLECQELEVFAFCDDGTLKPDTPLAIWGKEMHEASEHMERPLDVGPHIRKWMEDAGFVHVQQIIYKIPLNPWPKDPVYKEVGRKWEQVYLDGLGGFSYALFNRHFGRSKEEIEASLIGVRKDVSDSNIHSYHKYHVVIGRKPFDREQRRPSVDTVMNDA